MDVNLTAAEPLSFRRSSRAATQKPVRYSDALQLSSEDEDEEEDDDRRGTRSGADDRKQQGTQIASSDEKSRNSDDDNDRKPKSRASALKPPPSLTRKKTPASKPKAVPPRKPKVDSGDSSDDNSSKQALPVSRQSKGKASVRSASGQRARSGTTGAGGPGNRSGSYDEDASDSSALPTAATTTARPSTRPQRSATRRRGSPPPPTSVDDGIDAASSSAASSSEHDQNTTTKSGKPTSGKPLKTATTRRRDNIPQADKQVIVLVDSEDSGLQDNVLPVKSSKAQERAPATRKTSSHSSAATRTAPKNPLEGLLAGSSQALSEDVQEEISTHNDGQDDSQPSPAAAPSTGKRKRQAFGRSSGGEPSPRFKKKELVDTVDMTEDPDGAGDAGLPEEPNTRESNGTSNRKRSVFESPEELAQRTDRLVRTKAALSKTSSPITASSHPTTPLRFRRSPPKPKKRLSVLDFAKDEGFL